MAAEMERLYDFGEKLANSSDKSQNVVEYAGLLEAATGSIKAKLFAAQQLPRFFKHFPHLSAESINALLDLCEDDDINIRVTAIRGLPFLCKDNPEYLPKIADVLGQLLVGEDQEHTVVENSLMQVVRQNPRDSLSAVFKHIESSEEKLRENVLAFIRTKVFPQKEALLKPQAEMERHITDLIKGVQDVTVPELVMFVDFLRGLSLFGPKAGKEQMQELVETVEAHADLNSVFSVDDADHVQRVLVCLRMALPFFARGGSNSKFMLFVGRQMFPQFGKLTEARQTELLRSVAEASPYTAAPDARTLLPPLVSLTKELVPRKKASSAQPLDASHLEALLFTFNQLAHKAPNACNSLCGYKVVTGQPSDRLGEDFKDAHEDWLARLAVAEEDAKKQHKTASGEGQETAKALRSAQGEAAEKLKEKKAAAARVIASCTNTEKLAKGLHAKAPQFLGGSNAPRLSWLPPESAAAAAPKAGSAGAPADQKAKTPQAQGAGSGVKRPAGSAGNGTAAAAAAGQGKRARQQQSVASAAAAAAVAYQGHQMAIRSLQGLLGRGGYAPAAPTRGAAAAGRGRRGRR